MATRNPVVVPVMGQNGLDGYQVTWSGLLNGDVGGAVGSTIQGSPNAPGGGFTAGMADKTIQAVGIFGAAGSVACEGSNDSGANWFAMTAPNTGSVIALTAAGQSAVTEAMIWTRPHVTAGDGTTTLVVTMFFRKTQTP